MYTYCRLQSIWPVFHIIIHILWKYFNCNMQSSRLNSIYTSILWSIFYSFSVSENQTDFQTVTTLSHSHTMVPVPLTLLCKKNQDLNSLSFHVLNNRSRMEERKPAEMPVKTETSRQLILSMMHSCQLEVIGMTGWSNEGVTRHLY